MLSRTIGIFAMCAVATVAMTAKDFYCRDPDTGKLYPVNATWPSTSFCGRYICSLRKRNVTDLDAKNLHWRQSVNRTANEENRLKYSKEKIKDLPITKLIPLSKENMKKEDLETLLRKSQQHKITMNNAEYLQNKMYPDKREHYNHNNDDRYLTDAEIKALSIILKTLKKSDLEAILEVYSLAQDMYKQIDPEPQEILVAEAKKPVETTTKSSKGKDSDIASSNVHSSYWYEPLGDPKPKDGDLIPHVKSGDIVVKDAISEGSEFHPHIVIAHSHPTLQNSLPKQHQDPLKYFSSSNNEFMKLPYYYPISDFQKLASYSHQTPQVNVYQAREPVAAPVAVSAVKANSNVPCSHTQAQAHAQHYPELPDLYNSLLNWNQKDSHRPHVHHLIQINVPAEDGVPVTVPPQHLASLPYPVAVLPYNISTSPVPFIKNPWQFLSLNHQYRFPPAIVNYEHQPAFVGNPLNKALEIPEIHENLRVRNNHEQRVKKDNIPTFLDSIIKANRKPLDLEKSLFPDWQTNDLSVSIDKDVKRSGSTKFSQRHSSKNVKMERVGKVIKLDQHSRYKRSPGLRLKNKNDNVQYEAILEKAT